MPRALCLLLLAGLAATTSAELTDECLACMCFVSSQGCVMPDPVCVNTDWGEVCGPWAITLDYWKDGGYLGGGFHECTAVWECNESTVRNYLDKYVHSSSATCENYARVHAGGPNGMDLDFTLNYWYDVKYCLDNGQFPPPAKGQK